MRQKFSPANRSIPNAYRHRSRLHRDRRGKARGFAARDVGNGSTARRAASMRRLKETRGGCTRVWPRSA
jgi:hypothetical protein